MLRGGLPGEVRRHAPLLQGLPDILLVPVEVQRPLQHVQHVMGVVVQEGEAVAVPGVLVIGKHCVLKAAGLPDHRDGAIAHGQHLAEAAGLKAGGHQEDVRPRVHPVRQGAIHHKAGGHTARVVVLCPAEQVHIAGFPQAQHHELQVLLHDVRDHIVHQVQALLVAKPGDHGHHRHLRPDG